MKTGEVLKPGEAGQSAIGNLRLAEVDLRYGLRSLQNSKLGIACLVGNCTKADCNQVGILGQLHRSSADLFNSRQQRCRHFSYLDNIGALCTGAGRNSRRPLGALVNPASDGRNLGFLEGAFLRRHDVIVISTERDPFHQEAGGGFSRLNRLAVLASLERICLRVKPQLGLRFFLSVTLEAIRLQDRQHLFGKVDILGQYSRAGRCEKAEKNGWEKATASRFKLELRYRVHQMKFPHVRVLRDGCSR